MTGAPKLMPVLALFSIESTSMISITFRRLAPLALAASLGCTEYTAPDEPTAVIVFISEGAGAAHWMLTGLASDDLATARMPVRALMATRGSNDDVTGGASGATALATGVRSYLGAVGVGPDSLPRESALGVAHGLGWATGLITTARITDATPGSFAAHVPSRSQGLEIFQQMIDLPVRVLLGGGARVFNIPREQDAMSVRMQVRGQYTNVSSLAELQRSADTASTLFGLFSPEELPPAAQRSPTLAEMTEAALMVLDRDPDGFFLMVENEGSDMDAGGDLDREAIVAEMLSFDAAVGVGLEYHSRYPATLILVTANDETGGILLPDDADPDLLLEYGAGGATAVRVPIFAIGPGAERFEGSIGNDVVGQILLDLVRGANP